MAQLNTALCVDLQVEVREENDEIWCKDEKVKIIEAQWNRCLPHASSLCYAHSICLPLFFSLYGG